MPGGPGTNNRSHVRRLPSALVAVPVLPAISPLVERKRERARFPLFGLQLQIASPNGSIPGITPVLSAAAVPVGPRSTGLFKSSVIAAETAGCRSRSGEVILPRSQSFACPSSSA